MNNHASEIHSKWNYRLIKNFRSLSFRASVLLISFVAIGITLMAALSYQNLKAYTTNNAQIRIERASQSAAALLEARLSNDLVSEYNDMGLPTVIRLKGDRPLLSRAAPNAYDNLVSEISRVTGGASNLFVWDNESLEFARFATTFRRPDGSMPPAFSIRRDHPAYDTITKPQAFRGDVPVMGRMRYAYLTPILSSDDNLAGLLAIDVGWSDDLTSVQELLKQRIFGFGFAILAITVSVGGLLHSAMLAPIPLLSRTAHRIATGEQGLVVPCLHRQDEIADLAKGLNQVNKLYNKLENIAYSDPLTGLGNRVRFRRELELIYMRETSIKTSVVILLHINHFQAISENFGAGISNRVLVEAGKRIESISDERDSILARTAHNEFAIILHDCMPVEIDAFVHDLRKRFHEPIPIERSTIELTVNIGIAFLTESAPTPDEAERIAQLALRAADAKGTNNFEIYNPMLGARAKRDNDLFLSLRQELTNKENLCVYFQVQASAKTSEVFGLEALVRWRQHDGSMIMPGEFIPIAEHHGLIAELGLWIIDETCRIVRQWIDTEILVPKVSINVSPAQLWQPDFVESVRKIIESYHIPPQMICLEITEELFVNFSENKIRSVFEQLQSFGVKVAIDDFGSGYSSLGYLHQRLFDQVKIDRSLVGDFLSDPKKQLLLEGIITLASALKLEVVVEGAETESETRVLMQLDCDAIQGYFFTRPCPSHQVVQEMENVRQALSKVQTNGTTSKN